MAPTKSTTLRLSTELRDEIAQLAEQRGSSMVDVVAAAVNELKRQEWWNQVHVDLARIDDDYHLETQILDRAAGDGIA